MSTMTLRRRCGVCKKWMEVGEKFQFENFRWQGRNQTYPVHPYHTITDSDRNTLADVLIRAERNGHDIPEHRIESEKALSEKSLIDDLKKAVAQGKKFGYGYITHGYVESLIRRHEIQVPGDISDQPGAWQIRGGNVDAIQHDGTEEQANVITAWITTRGGIILRRFTETATTLGTETYLRIQSSRTPVLVGPDWWVVCTADGQFFAVSDSDFHILYVPREDTSHAV